MKSNIENNQTLNLSLSVFGGGDKCICGINTNSEFCSDCSK